MILLPAVLLCACAVDFTGKSFQETGAKPRVKLELQVNGVDLEPGEGLLDLYAGALPEGSANCEAATIKIDGEVRTERKSAWYLGMAFMVPFWPAMPSKSTLTYTLEAFVACEGEVRQRVVLAEAEEREMFFYGAVRTGPITEASDFIHLKLAARLAEALKTNKPADYTTRSDF